MSILVTSLAHSFCRINVVCGPTYGCKWALGLNVLQTAQHKVEHTFIEAVCLGILANLMVCLAVWMSYAGRTLIDKLLH